MIGVAVNGLNNGILGIFWQAGNQFKDFFRRKMAHHVLKHFEGNPCGTGLFAIAAEHTGIPNLVSSDEVVERVGGGHMAPGDPFFHIQGVVGSGNLNRAHVNAAVALDAFPKVVLPEGFPLRLSHGQHLLKGCGGGNFLIFFNRFKSPLGNRCQGVFQWIFQHACCGAVTALDAFGLIDLDSIGPQLAIYFGSRVVFINELGCAVATAGTFIHVNVPGLFPNLNFQIPLFSFDALDGGAGMDLYIDMPADLDQFR